MNERARQTGLALEAMYRFILWLVPTVEKFPRSQKVLLGDRIQATALHVLESLIEATYTRRRERLLVEANLGAEKLRFLFRLATELRRRLPRFPDAKLKANASPASGDDQREEEMKLSTLAAIAIAAAFLAAAVPRGVFAQTYPSGPIQMVVPFPPGGATDITARAIANKLDQNLGRPVNVVNRPGRRGIVGHESVANAKPDGYTLLFTTFDSLDASGEPDLPYDPKRHFTLVVEVADRVFGLVVNPSVAANSVPELVQQAKRAPGTFTSGHTGEGSITERLGKEFNRAAKVDLRSKPFAGLSIALQALMNGVTSMMFVDMGSAERHVRAQQFKLLAITGAARDPAYPATPVISESLPGFKKPPTAFAVFAPAGTPQPVLARLSAEMDKALSANDVREKLSAAGLRVRDVLASMRAKSAALSPADKAGAGELFKQAFELFQAGEFEAAALQFNKGLAIDPANGVAHFYLAETYERQQKTTQAREHYRRTIDFAPDSKEAAMAQTRIGK
jgi:tripartite-type tricarboxylate transporter receptor subunit TctC